MRADRAGAEGRGSRGADAAAVGVGAVAGLVVGASFRRGFRPGATNSAGIGLIVAAAIYPASRRSSRTGGLTAEAAALAAAAGVTGLAATRESAAARRLLAGGWVAHTLYDVLQGPSPDSRLPRWYPALCVGFDVALAAQLVR